MERDPLERSPVDAVADLHRRLAQMYLANYMAVASVLLIGLYSFIEAKGAAGIRSRSPRP